MLLSACFAKNQCFLAKIVPLLKAIVWELCKRLFGSVFSVCKITINENNFFIDCASWIWLADCSKLAKNYQNENDVTIFQHDVGHDNFFEVYFVSLVKFSYWSKFHAIIITGSGVLTILFYKGLTKNAEIKNIPLWVLLISRDWDKLGIPNSARMSLIKSHWMLQKSQGYNFLNSDYLETLFASCSLHL